MRRMPVVRGTAAVMAFLTLTTVSASTLMFTYSGAINKALNINTSKIVETDDASAVNTAYYDSEFGTDYTNKQAALKVEMEVAAENVTQAEEGTVLLRNENAALPLDSASRVTIFGNGAAHSRYGRQHHIQRGLYPDHDLWCGYAKGFWCGQHQHHPAG